MNTLEARLLEADTLEAAAEIIGNSIARSNATPQTRTVERALVILLRAEAEKRGLNSAPAANDDRQSAA